MDTTRYDLLLSSVVTVFVILFLLFIVVCSEAAVQQDDAAAKVLQHNLLFYLQNVYAKIMIRPIMMMMMMTKTHSFLQKSLPASVGQFAKFRGFQQENCQHSAAHRNLPIHE